MLSKENFKEIYTTQLKNEFADFDARRKTGVILDIIGFVPLIGSFLILLPITIANGANKETMVVPAIGIFGGFVFLLLMKYVAQKILFPLIDQYPETIIKPIVNSISPNWQYSIDGSVGAIEVGASKLFDKNYNEFSGSNLVYGIIDKTEFRSSFLNISYRQNNPQSSGSSFGGFFFHADFNKHFNGETIVANSDLRDMAEAFKNLASSTKFIQLENQEFNKLFKIKTSDQTEARYILTPIIMENLIKIKNYYGGPILFSFVGKRVYCAINGAGHLFKLHFYKTVNKWEFVEKIYDMYAFNEVLVKELNLNTRIWTKA